MHINLAIRLVREHGGIGGYPEELLETAPTNKQLTEIAEKVHKRVDLAIQVIKEYHNIKEDKKDSPDNIKETKTTVSRKL